MRRLLTCAVVLATAGPAVAGVLPWAFPGVQGTWSTAAGCEWLKRKNDPKATWPRDMEDYAYLKQGGVEGYEWGCEFVRIDEDSYDSIVVTASCTAEGDGWPDLFLLQRDYKAGWRLANRAPDGKINVTLFPERCDKP